MQSSAVFRRIASGRSLRDEPPESGLALWLTIVMRARSAAQQSKAILDTFVSSERVGNPALEPTQHPRADATQHGSISPCAAKQPIEFVRAPHGQQVRGTAATDIEHILRCHERGEINVRAGRRGNADESNKVRSVGIQRPLNAR